MFDELDKIRCALTETIAKLQDQLEPVLKQVTPLTDGEPGAERQQRSEVCLRLETHADQLGKMLRTIQSIAGRLDIPS